MAFLALDGGVLAFQRETGFLVFEFEIESERRPAFGGVAITARNFDIPVRMVRRGDLRICFMKGFEQ
jgi:hypothetical protein